MKKGQENMITSVDLLLTLGGKIADILTSLLSNKLKGKIKIMQNNLYSNTTRLRKRTCRYLQM